MQVLVSFERIHGWWSDETFTKLDNQTLRNFVRDTIRETPYIESLVTTGTTADMEQLKSLLLETCPKMAQATLMNLLDYLYAFDMAGNPFSKELVAWYRTQGWQFPKFSHESDLQVK